MTTWKPGNRATSRSSYIILGHTPKWLYIPLLKYGHCCSVHRSQKLNRLDICQWMNEWRQKMFHKLTKEYYSDVYKMKSAHKWVELENVILSDANSFYAIPTVLKRKLKAVSSSLYPRMMMFHKFFAKHWYFFFWELCSVLLNWVICILNILGIFIIFYDLESNPLSDM